MPCRKIQRHPRLSSIQKCVMLWVEHTIPRNKIQKTTTETIFTKVFTILYLSFNSIHSKFQFTMAIMYSFTSIETTFIITFPPNTVPDAWRLMLLLWIFSLSRARCKMWSWAALKGSQNFITYLPTFIKKNYINTAQCYQWDSTFYKRN